VFTLSNLYLVVCLYVEGFNSQWRDCGSSSKFWPLSFVLGVLPFLVRLLQSIKRYADSGLQTHMINVAFSLFLFKEAFNLVLGWEVFCGDSSVSMLLHLETQRLHSTVQLYSSLILYSRSRPWSKFCCLVYFSNHVFVLRSRLGNFIHYRL
jgi:hypothetical protein